MEENPEISMAKSVGKIIRVSVFTFLQNYQFFSYIAAIIALPFSLSVLLCQALFPPSFSLLSLFPSSSSSSSSSAFFSLVAFKLSRSLCSSFLTLPFSLSFLLFAKAAAIHHLTGHDHLPWSLWKVYSSLLATHLWNSVLIFSINAACFSLLLLAISLLDTTVPMWGLLVLAMGAVVYSIAFAHAMVLCTMALAYSGMGGRGGLRALICAYNTIRSRTSTALALALPANLGLAAVEALFHVRIIALTHQKENGSTTQLWLLALEGLFIAYLYSILLVLDVITSCFFYQSCRGDPTSQTNEEVQEEGNRYRYDHFIWKG